MDDFIAYSSMASHLECLRLMLLKFREKRVCQNPYKNVFEAYKGILLGHIVSRNGIEMTNKKLKAI